MGLLKLLNSGKSRVGLIGWLVTKAPRGALAWRSMLAV